MVSEDEKLSLNHFSGGETRPNTELELLEDQRRPKDSLPQTQTFAQVLHKLTFGLHKRYPINTAQKGNTKTDFHT